jgi:hypothetical protein
MENKFKCSHCHQAIIDIENIGTRHRNHCPKCLWSLHVDDMISGDRKSLCHGQMEPVGLTFKNEGKNKYGKLRQGELMIIHSCKSCDKISINRIAGDDESEMIKDLFKKSGNNHQLRKRLELENIKLLGEKDQDEVKSQLYGKR